MPPASFLSGLFALSQSQVGFIQLLSLRKCHENAQCYEVAMMMVIVMVVVQMNGSPKPEDGYIWVCIKAMLAR